MYFATVDVATGSLASLRLVPTQVRKFQVIRAPLEGAQWLRDVLDREGKRFSTCVEDGGDGTLVLRSE